MTECARNTSGPEDILAHLKSCDAAFVPRLSSRVSLSDYASKLADRAHRLEAWENGKLIGLVATYFGSDRRAFITNVSTAPLHAGQGIGQGLLKETLADARDRHCRVVALEVSAEATSALRLYQKVGFLIKTNHTQETPGFLTCELEL